MKKKFRFRQLTAMLLSAALAFSPAASAAMPVFAEETESSDEESASEDSGGSYDDDSSDDADDSSSDNKDTADESSDTSDESGGTADEGDEDPEDSGSDEENGASDETAGSGEEDASDTADDGSDEDEDNTDDESDGNDASDEGDGSGEDDEAGTDGDVTADDDDRNDEQSSGDTSDESESGETDEEQSEDTEDDAEADSEDDGQAGTDAEEDGTGDVTEDAGEEETSEIEEEVSSVVSISVDTVSVGVGTVSTTAAAASVSAETSFGMDEEVYYSADGTSVTLTVSNPDTETNYSEIEISYSMGKNSGTLEEGTDYEVELESGSDDELIYLITILADSEYNSIGQSLTVTSAGETAGSFEIVSSAAVSIVDNVIIVEGDGGETAADYIDCVSEIEIVYTDADGEEQSVTYVTVQRQGNNNPEYTNSDLFDSETGAINLDCGAFAMGSDWEYTITLTASGFDDVTAVVGGASDDEATGTTLTVTMPEGLEDGVYTGDAEVEPDDDDGFNFYPISVSVTVEDGTVTGMSVSGASGSNVQYSYRAETGIASQIEGMTAGTYEVDAVTMATCSSTAIVEAINEAFGNEASYTTYGLGDAIYDPDGTTVELYIYDPEDGADYSDIGISYALGKFAAELTADEDFTAELISEDEDTIVYQITIDPEAYFTVDDDTASGDTLYNTLGLSLDVTVNGSSAGRFTIEAGFAASIVDNTIVLDGDTVTVEEYISGINEVVLEYTDEDGGAVSETYTTQLAHDVYPDYYGSDIFNEDGSVNFDCAIFVYGSEWTYTITVSSNGFDDVTAEIGAVTEEEEDSTEGTAGSIVIPEDIEDGEYTGTATVTSDRDSWEDYEITVTVTISGGALVSYTVSGDVDEENDIDYSRYTGYATDGRTRSGVYYTGISEVIVGQSAGTYGVDAVSGATCSTNAIVEAINAALASAVSDTDDDDEEESGGTSYEFSEAVYDESGTSFTLTVSNPSDDTDYSDVALTNTFHSTVTTLTADEDYTVDIEITDDEVVYTFTIISSSYNSSGTSFDVLIAGESAGNVEIVADVEISLENNAIVISDESAVTLEDYLGAITSVTISYVDDDGETVSATYSTTTDRYTSADYEATDLFSSEDGSVNFDCEAFANGENETYTITITAQGYADVTGEVGNETEEETSGGSAGTVTMPEGLEDGVYSGTGMVEPDDDDGFNFYYITVAVTVSDGAVESFTVSGADGSNTQYSYRAETGINEQIAGITAGSYEVDAVTTATRSSIAIVEAINEAFGNEASYTTYGLGDAVYDPEGTSVELYIYEPEDDVDYSDIAISYALGKFAAELTVDEDFTTELISEDEDTIVYLITLDPEAYFTVDDDTASGDTLYNSLGMSLDVTVNGSSAGRFTIEAGFAASIVDNTIVLDGDTVTVEEYISGIHEVVLEYTDEDGEAVSETYTTQLAHDVYPDYYGSDIFNEDGSVNFDCAIFVYGSEWTYTITVSSNGFDDVTAEVGAVTEDEEEASGGSAGTVTMPEGLEDGVYSGTGMVEPDDDDGFNFYYITVAVTVSDGAVESFTVSGADGNNTQYSYRAETGINEQLAGITAGSYDVDVVSMATCSSYAIVEAINDAFTNEASYTTYELGDAIYDPDGTEVTLTIYNPEDDVDYSDISLSYAVGKFASELEEGTDFTAELVSSGEDEIVYLITILSGSGSTIEDDTEDISVEYNSLGMNLDVAVAGTTVGRITIDSGATAAIVDNTIVVEGNDDVSVEDYIEGIGEVTLTYTDEDGNEVSVTYTTKLAHDVYPEYYAEDIFNEDGSINFDCAIFVYGSSWTYTITIEANGFEDLTAEIGNVSGDDDDDDTDDTGTDDSDIRDTGAEDETGTSAATPTDYVSDEVTDGDDASEESEGVTEDDDEAGDTGTDNADTEEETGDADVEASDTEEDASAATKTTSKKSSGSSGTSSGSGSNSISVGTIYADGTSAGIVGSDGSVTAGAWQSTAGGWRFSYDNGSRSVADSWAKLTWNGVTNWYLFDAYGYMVSGWYTDPEGNTFFLHDKADGTQGYMYTGWKEIDGRMYYFEETEGSAEGRLYRSTVTPDGSVVDETGVKVQ